MKTNTIVVAELNGKIIRAHNQSIKLTLEQKQEFFGHLKTLETLRSICTLSNCHFMKSEYSEYKGVPYNDNILCIAAQLILMFSNRNTGEQPTDEGLKYILQIALGVEEQKLAVYKESPLSLLMKVAYDQTWLYEKPVQSIGRVWAIYNYAWKLVPKQKLDPLSEIKRIVGISYEEILVYGFLASSQKEGHLFELSVNDIELVSKETGLMLAMDGQTKFLSWISCSYEDFIKETQPEMYVKCPIINSQESVRGYRSCPYFIPAPNALFARMSLGLYHDLARKFDKGRGDNQFKVEYGKAFEKYIGMLLKLFLTSYEVNPEIEFGTKGKKQASVDYLVMKNNALVLIEVKQSSIHSSAKATGNIEQMMRDFETSVIKAIKQIRSTELGIKTDKMFDKFNKCKTIIKIIVFGDPLYNSNGLITNLLKEKANIDASDIGFINISDLERLLDIQSSEQNFADLLEDRLLNFNRYDFREFMLKKYDLSKQELPVFRTWFNEVVKIGRN